MRLALLILLTSVTASPAFADANEASLVFSSRSLRSNSANAISDDNLAGGELSYARGLPVALPGEIGLQLVGGFNWNTVSGRMFDMMDTAVSSTGFSAGLRARYPLHRRVVLSARADLGMNHTSLDLEMSGRTFSDGRWHALSRGAVGVEAYVVRSPRFAVGARVELGYVLATAAELAPREGTPDGETIMLPETQSSIGGLDLGGRYFSFAFVVGF